MTTFRLTAKRKAEILEQFRAGKTIGHIWNTTGHRAELTHVRLEQVIREAMKKETKP